MQAFPVYVELEGGHILVSSDHFAKLAQGEVVSDATSENSYVRDVAQALRRTPKPTSESLSLPLDPVQLKILLAISVTVASSLRRQHYGLGVYGNIAVLPDYDDDYTFWVCDLKSGALIATNPHLLDNMRASVNAAYSDDALFDDLEVFMERHLAKPTTTIDVEDVDLESYRRFGNSLAELVQALRGGTAGSPVN
jgi:hypothetical protein